MKLSELKNLLEEWKTVTGMPYAYSAVKKGVTAPFLVYLGTSPDFAYADNTIYYSEEHFDIEYYFQHKDPETEHNFEQLLLKAGAVYSKSEDINVEDSDLHYITYSI